MYNHSADENSNENKKVQESSGLLLRRVEYLPDSRTQLVDIGKVFPTVSNRLFSSRNAWGRVEDETGSSRFVIAYQPRDLDEAEFNKIQKEFGNLVKGTARQVQIIEKVATNVSRITLVANLDAGGMIPVAIANKLLSSYLDQIKDLYEVFERRGKEVDAEVGCADEVLVSRKKNGLR